MRDRTASIENWERLATTGSWDRNRKTRIFGVGDQRRKSTVPHIFRRGSTASLLIVNDVHDKRPCPACNPCESNTVRLLWSISTGDSLSTIVLTCLQPVRVEHSTTVLVHSNWDEKQGEE